ncbi:DUF1648 domain-containing protein [Salinibacterium sp. dk5596]|nr:DUF1648 domain-containing protein [Salinibacterium sp. dk5596]
MAAATALPESAGVGICGRAAFDIGSNVAKEGGRHGWARLGAGRDRGRRRPAGWPRERPPAEFVSGPVTRALRWLSVGMPAVGAAVLLAVYGSLPEVVPTHFGFTGEADAWGPRWNVLVLAGVWLAMSAGLVALSRFPRVFNYPVPVTEENAQRLYREGARMTVWTAFGCSVIFGGAVASMLGWSAGPVIVAGILVLLAALFGGIARMMLVADAPRR